MNVLIAGSGECEVEQTPGFDASGVRGYLNTVRCQYSFLFSIDCHTIPKVVSKEPATEIRQSVCDMILHSPVSVMVL